MSFVLGLKDQKRQTKKTREKTQKDQKIRFPFFSSENTTKQQCDVSVVENNNTNGEY